MKVKVKPKCTYCDGGGVVTMGYSGRQIRVCPHCDGSGIQKQTPKIEDLPEAPKKTNTYSAALRQDFDGQTGEWVPYR